MKVLEGVVLFLIGLISGTFGSVVGLGGGVIIVPSLLFFQSLGLFSHPLSPQNAVGISLMVMIFTAFAATLFNYKQKRVDVKSGLFFFLASGSAATIGAMINKYIQLKQFYILFGIVMLFITYMLTRQNKMKPKNVKWSVIREYIDGEGNKYEYGYNKLVAFSITGFAGLLAGLFGIGGGAILVPMMVILFRFPPHVATATSMFIILMSASIGSVSHIILGNIIFLYVLFIGPGAFIGGRLGSLIASKLSSKTLVTLLQVIIILVAIQMIYKGIS